MSEIALQICKCALPVLETEQGRSTDPRFPLPPLPTATLSPDSAAGPELRKQGLASDVSGHTAQERCRWNQSPRVLKLVLKLVQSLTLSLNHTRLLWDGANEGQKTASKMLVSQILEPTAGSAVWTGMSKAADGIRWPAGRLSGWPSVITKVLTCGRGRQERRPEGPSAAGFEGGGRGHEAGIWGDL